MRQFMIYIALILAATAGMLVGCGERQNVTASDTQLSSVKLATETFAGYYELGPDVSSFVTCAMSQPPGPGVGYWLVAGDSFRQAYENPDGISLGNIASTYGPYDRFAIFVRFEGTLEEEPGVGYGHGNQYSGEVRVAKILAVSRQWVGSTFPPAFFTGCEE